MLWWQFCRMSEFRPPHACNPCVWPNECMLNEAFHNCLQKYATTRWYTKPSMSCPQTLEAYGIKVLPSHVWGVTSRHQTHSVHANTWCTIVWKHLTGQPKLKNITHLMASQTEWTCDMTPCREQEPHTGGLNFGDHSRGINFRSKTLGVQTSNAGDIWQSWA